MFALKNKTKQLNIISRHCSSLGLLILEPWLQNIVSYRRIKNLTQRFWLCFLLLSDCSTETLLQFLTLCINTKLYTHPYNYSTFINYSMPLRRMHYMKTAGKATVFAGGWSRYFSSTRILKRYFSSSPYLASL